MLKRAQEVKEVSVLLISFTPLTDKHCLKNYVIGFHHKIFALPKPYL